jgi:epsilon-lactone hydrolase
MKPSPLFLSTFRCARAALFCAILGLSAVALLPGVSLAQETRKIDPDGTIHVPAFVLPESSLLSEETRASLKHMRDTMEPDSKVCPAISDRTDRATMATARGCEAKEFYKSAFYKSFRDQFDVVVTTRVIGGVPTEVFTPKSGIAPKNKDRVLINVHGGHFKAGSRTISHLESMPIASVGKIQIISIDYRMAPEYAFPAASEDVAAVYRELLKTYKPQNIGIYGCSAGSLLAAESIAWFQKKGLPLPAAVGMFGGAASYYQEGDSGHLASVLDAFELESPEKHPYFKATAPKDPEAFPIYSPQIMAKFPPSLLIATTRDVGESAVVYTHSRLVKLGVEADLHVWEGLGHCFFSMPEVPESHDVYDVVVKFFDQHLGK